MDSLKSLMDKRQYDLVIRLTETANEATPLFYRISALLASGKGEQALECIKKNRAILQADTPMLMRVHIEILCLLQKFDEAYEEMKYYDSLPYISQEVEELLKELPKLIRDEEKKAYSFKNLDKDELIDALHSDDMPTVLMALDTVRDRDINAYLKEIEHVMTNFAKQSVRSFALLLLVQKQVNRTFNFNHMGEVITVNPSLLEPPFVDEKFTELVKRMDAEFRNPTLAENATRILSAHILYIYPDKIDLDIEVMVEALFQIANKYLQSKNYGTIEERCATKDISTEEVRKLMEEIEASQEDF